MPSSSVSAAAAAPTASSCSRPARQERQRLLEERGVPSPGALAAHSRLLVESYRRVVGGQLLEFAQEPLSVEAKPVTGADASSTGSLGAAGAAGAAGAGSLGSGDAMGAIGSTGAGSTGAGSTGSGDAMSTVGLRDGAEALLLAPFALVSHGVQAEPLFNYGNALALHWFELSWQELCLLPSRRSAEPVAQAERERLLSQVREQGFIRDYRGVRISAKGRRFWIVEATVWNLIDESGAHRGQAACFASVRAVAS